MSLSDLLLFLTGDAAAIGRLATDPWSPIIGAILVLSASLARHYDRQDLRRQAWWLLVPFAASTLAAGILFVVVAAAARRGVTALPFGVALLGLFWLTSPFAWLYGIPFERLASPARAAAARRGALALVATARVALMTRCLQVLLGYDAASSLAVVMAFAIPTALLAMAVASYVRWRFYVQQLPPQVARDTANLATRIEAGRAARDVVDAMGGVGLDLDAPFPPVIEERFEQTPHPAAGCFVVLALILLGVSAALLPRGIGLPPHWPDAGADLAKAPPDPSVWALAILSVLLWIPALLRCQPAHQRRTNFTDRLCTGDLPAAIRDLASLHPADFPPHWHPASTLADRPFAPRMFEAARQVAILPDGSWVRTGFLQRFGPMLPVWLDTNGFRVRRGFHDPEEAGRELAELAKLLRDLPEGAELLAPYQEYLVKLCAYAEKGEPERVESLQSLLALTLRRGEVRGTKRTDDAHD